jgi:hypothetical protein
VIAVASLDIDNLTGVKDVVGYEQAGTHVGQMISLLHRQISDLEQGEIVHDEVTVWFKTESEASAVRALRRVLEGLGSHARLDAQGAPVTATCGVIFVGDKFNLSGAQASALTLMRNSKFHSKNRHPRKSVLATHKALEFIEAAEPEENTMADGISVGTKGLFYYPMGGRVFAYPMKVVAIRSKDHVDLIQDGEGPQGAPRFQTQQMVEISTFQKTDCFVPNAAIPPQIGVVKLPEPAPGMGTHEPRDTPTQNPHVAAPSPVAGLENLRAQMNGLNDRLNAKESQLAAQKKRADDAESHAEKLADRLVALESRVGVIDNGLQMLSRKKPDEKKPQDKPAVDVKPQPQAKPAEEKGTEPEGKAEDRT